MMEVLFWHERGDDLRIRYGNFSSQLCFSCLRGESSQWGRPRYHLPENTLLDLHQIQRRWRVVAESMGVSYRTLLRWRHEYMYCLSLDSTRGPSSIYTEITQNDLSYVIWEVLQILPNAGESFLFLVLSDKEIFMSRGGDWGRQLVLWIPQIELWDVVLPSFGRFTMSLAQMHCGNLRLRSNKHKYMYTQTLQEVEKCKLP